MSNPRRIFKNTVVLTLNSVTQQVGNILLFFYLSRLLQVEGVGIYTTAMAVFQTASIGCSMGFDSFIPRELAKDLSKTNRYLIHASLVGLTSALLLILVLLLVIPHTHYLPQTKVGIYIMSLVLIPTALLTVWRAVFITYGKAEYIAVPSLVAIVGRIVSGLGLLALGFSEISLLVTYAVFSYLLLAVTPYFLWKHIIHPHWEFDRRFLWAMLGELKVFMGMVLLGTLFSQAEVLILSVTRGEDAVGLYSAAWKLVTPWVMIPSNYMATVFPVLTMAYQQSDAQAAEIQNRSIKYLWAVAFPLTVGLVTVAGVVVPLFYGSSFHEAIPALRILAWYLPLNFCNTVFWRSLLARDEHRLVLRGQFLTDVFRAGLALLLTPRFGFMGAAVAMVLGRTSGFGYNAYHLRRLGMPLPLLRLGGKLALAAGVMGVTTWAALHWAALRWPTSQWLSVSLIVPLAAGVYGLLIVALRAFDADDLDGFRQIWRRGKAYD